jgi:hypothetical protein
VVGGLTGLYILVRAYKISIDVARFSYHVISRKESNLCLTIEYESSQL